MDTAALATTDTVSLTDKFLRTEGRVFLTGTQALVRVLLDQKRADRAAGLNTAGLVSGYPGSPLGGVDFELARNRDIFAAHDVVHIPGLNEELAATAVFGTQLLKEVPGARFDGVFGMWFGKAPGVDRAADAMHHANFHGVPPNGGVLAVAGDDPHARSTILPSDSNTIFASFYMPVLSPGNIQEILDFGRHGYALSRAAGLWVGFKLVSDVCDGIGTAEVGADRVRPVLPQVTYDGAPFTPPFRANAAGPPMLEVEREIVQARLEIARRYAALNRLNRITVDPPQARIGLLSSGKTYYDLCEALRALGLDAAALQAAGIRVLKMGMVWPFEPGIAREFARGLDEIIVVEDKRPLLELHLKEALYRMPGAPVITGKFDADGSPLLEVHGEISAESIARTLRRKLAHLLPAPVAAAPLRNAPLEPLPLSRLPYFCSGCPHNRALKVPEGAVVGAGIGCHIMTLWMQPVFGDVVGYTQMGGEGAQFVGLAPFSDTKHYFQNLGDGTFSHSGSLAIRFAVAAGTNITYKLLYNSAVAMTGGQDITGGKSVARIAQELAAEGVARIIVTTDEPERYHGQDLGAIARVMHRDNLLQAERELAAVPGVTVLINDQQCAAEKRRLRKRGKLERKPRSVFINTRVCEGCGDCGAKSNCLSVEPVETPFGRKTQIHQSSCNQDYSCLLGDCPSFLTIENAVPAQAQGRGVPAVPLPNPELQVDPANCSVFMTGIGGTGVVTVNQILGMAASLAGLHVRGMDQTGSSQKAGPVVSHLHFSAAPLDGANRVMPGTADLFLAFDMLVAAEAVHVRMAAPDRTIVVGSRSKVPTGDLVSNAAKRYPDPALLQQRLETQARRAASVFIDARRLAEEAFGSDVGANMVLLGAALQAGALPLPAEAIEQAVRLNNVAVEMNLAALRLGRIAVHAPQALERVETAAPRPAVSGAVRRLVDALDPAPALREILELRVGELLAYQGRGLARRYLEVVRRVQQAEAKLGGGRGALAEAVATWLFKLLAVKDEYEVARLLLDPAARREIAERFGKQARAAWHFQPPLLRGLGLNRKLRLGRWFAPFLHALRAARMLRGTALDPFGNNQVRRTERALRDAYVDMLDRACALLNAENYPLVVELARLPDLVRGYDEVKLRSLARFDQEASRLLAALGSLTGHAPLAPPPPRPAAPAGALPQAVR